MPMWKDSGSIRIVCLQSLPCITMQKFDMGMKATRPSDICWLFLSERSDMLSRGTDTMKGSLRYHCSTQLLNLSNVDVRGFSGTSVPRELIGPARVFQQDFPPSQRNKAH